MLVRFLNTWKDLSLSRKLYAIMGLVALLVAAELAALWLVMDTLSALRAMVGGEGAWSKAQKDAVIVLQRYAVTEDEDYFRAFQNIIQIPIADGVARQQLEQAEPNMDIVTRGLLSGRIPLNDVAPMVRMIGRLKSSQYMKRALKIWKEGDESILSLLESGHRIQTLVRSKRNPARDKAIRSEMVSVWELNDDMSATEEGFSYALGEASRWFENIIWGLLGIMALTVGALGFGLVSLFNRDLSRFLREVVAVTESVGKGDFTKQMLVRTKNELGKLAEAINRMITNLRSLRMEREKAEVANHVKDLFLANISHEIRTPLAAIVGFTDLLRDPSLSVCERDQYMDVIRHTSRNMTKIIDDLLDISKIEAGQIDITPTTFSLRDLLSEIELMLTFRCRQKNLGLRFIPKGDIPDLIKTDSLRLKQIFLNLLGNAIKFTDRGEITITYEMIGMDLQVYVRDQGQGIPRDQQSRIFRPFSQADCSFPKQEGAGLGLVVAQKLASLMGGTVQLVESAPGKGSTFLFRVRTLTPDSPVREMQANQGSVPDLTGRNILLVEDAPENQLLLKLYLTRNGAHVTLAKDGRECVEKAIKEDFDVILMDMQMPIMDGYMATRALRRLGVGVPIVALTAHAMKDDRAKCLDAGCTDYLSKPVERSTLIQTVSKHL